MSHWRIAGQFSVSVPFLIFCLDDLSFDVSGMLKSPTVIVLLSVCLFVFANICFMYLVAPMLGAYIFTIVISFFLDWSLDHYVINVLHFLLLQSSFYSLYCLIWIWQPQLSFHFHLHGISSLIPSLLVCVSLYLKWLSCRQHICGSCFCIHSAILFFFYWSI